LQHLQAIQKATWRQIINQPKRARKALGLCGVRGMIFDKPVLKVAFSGGETSAYMAKRLKAEYSDMYFLIFVFANTGQENEQTLEFARRCDEAWGLNLIWVEAVVHPGERRGSTHRIVTFDTASRNGEPFEAVIQKYGIPNMDFEPCNRELKLNAMNSYMRSIGLPVGSYSTAIGIRADEARRVNEKQAVEAKIIYPLIDFWPTDKQDVNTFFEEQPFRLRLQEHEGNCKTCWKKSDKKLFRLVGERPWVFDFNRRMEEKYGYHGAPFYGNPPPGAKPRVFFRKHRSTNDLFAEAQALGVTPYIPIKEVKSTDNRYEVSDTDAGGCGESCEPYGMVGI
jgi:3'-phosphoadenosine 5'-phosphosulfate sulfotransferase (PAPS reductase)/FAD synthetase